MTRNELDDAYFNWMYHLVCNDRYFRKLSYRRLLRFLYDTDFDYQLEMDGNRFEDGVDLRYRFGYERNINNAQIAAYLDDKPCSVLEMIVALAIRLEEHIMDNPEVGNRTGQWFWNMVTNLGLGHMDDSKFDEDKAEDVIQRFMDRKYERNGKGGLFTVNHCRFDLRDMEIWYQACWYLDSVE